MSDNGNNGNGTRNFQYTRQPHGHLIKVFVRLPVVRVEFLRQEAEQRGMSLAMLLSEILRERQARFSNSVGKSG